MTSPSVDLVPRGGWHRMFTEPRRPPGIRERPNAYRYAVAAVCVGAFMGQLDASIVTLALPSLQRDFHTSVGAVTWVGLTYLLVLVTTVTAVGRFADMVGRKLLYLYGFGVFIVGSALCGLAPNLIALDCFRVLQGLGAAMLQANSVAIIYLAAPRRALGRAIGTQGAAQALGLALGPSIGGLLLGAAGWRLIFWINVPVGLLGIAAGLLFIPRSRHLQRRVAFDWVGLGLLAPTIVALLSAVSFGNRLGWGSVEIVVLLVVTLACGVAFVAWERRAPAPMLDLSLFSRPAFSAGIASGLLSYLVLFGTLFVVPFALEGGQGLGAARVGLELTVMPLALGAVAPLAGRGVDRFGARPLTVTGMVLTAVMLGVLGLTHPNHGLFVVELGLVGVGLGLFTPANNAAIMGASPRESSGMASGVLNMTRGMGTAMGLAFTGLVFGLAGGAAANRVDIGHGFTAALLFLAALAGVAAVLAGLRGPSPVDTVSPDTVSPDTVSPDTLFSETVPSGTLPL
ncbi:MAG TPA: DHA2 family efflux MFS transporter permease subunit [Acidimicrobiales bacterium]|nr:DHA2 family efflux MFS transporter permease subunit [Acidimicrobiales bacterium]